MKALQISFTSHTCQLEAFGWMIGAFFNVIPEDSPLLVWLRGNDYAIEHSPFSFLAALSDRIFQRTNCSSNMSTNFDESDLLLLLGRHDGRRQRRSYRIRWWQRDNRKETMRRWDDRKYETMRQSEVETIDNRDDGQAVEDVFFFPWHLSCQACTCLPKFRKKQCILELPIAPIGA